jgi:RNA recognition motif-containing protein
MNTKLCLSGLAKNTTYQEIMDLFSAYGNVAEVYLSIDRTTGRPLGAGLVTMATPEGAHAALKALQGKDMGTTTLTVCEAGPPERRVSSDVGQKPGGSSRRK